MVVAPQFFLKLMKRSHALLRFLHKLAVGLKDFKAQGIVNVADDYSVLPHGFAEKHVLVSIMSETKVNVLS